MTIRRTAATAPRKYGHAAPVDLASMEFPPPASAGGRVLLVDDIGTTGATLTALRNHLAGLGVEAVPLALGLNWRLCRGCDDAALSEQWEAAANVMHGTARDANERRRDRRKASSMIERRSCADPARRARLERDPAGWLRWYLEAAFPLPWGGVHRDIIAAAVRAIRTGAGMATAAPRGTGKTTVLAGVALWAVLSGACRFPVVAGWSHQAARRMLRKWIATLADNDRLRADYPEVCGPFEVSTHANRLKGMAWADTGDLCGADVRVMDGALVLPDGRGALGAVSIAGNVRGLHAGLPDGSTIRPDVLLLDDPQDKPTAESPKLTRQTVERIESDLFNLSGPGTRLSVMVACTVANEGDVAEYFLTHADFEAVRVGQVTQWPDGFADKASPARRLWEQWNAVRVEGLSEHDGGKRARAFYKANKAAMVEGMAVSWPARFDKKRHDPDAFYAAMFDYYRLGERAFMAERQNAPMRTETTVYDLSAALVATRIHPDRRRGELPAEARLIVAATDLNHYGLHSAAAGFGNDQTAWLAWYGRHDNNGRGIVPTNCPESEAKRAMFEALVAHGAGIAALPLTRAGEPARPSLWVIDAGYMPDVVRRYLDGPARTLGIPVMCARGFSADKYRPGGKGTIGAPRENCHLAESTVAGRFLAFNADAWREVSQRAWLASPNAPGSLSLFDGARHAEFAEQVTREKLVEKLSGQFGPVWRWHSQPGWHDYGDAVTMLYVAAAWGGIGTGGGAAPRQQRPAPRRQCHVPMDEDYSCGTTEDFGRRMTRRR